MEDLANADLYGLFDIAQSATLKEIKTAYRKKALSCHPDKNPDNPRAAERFHELSRALEILTDVSARAAYDKVLFSKAQAKIRAEKLDAKRKKFKDDLEFRENEFKKSTETKKTHQTRQSKSDEQKFKEEIERLQKEGSKLVEEEINFVSQKIAEEFGKKSRNFGGKSENFGENAKIKIKWSKNDEDVYNYDVLHRILSKYGDIIALVVSASKRGRALVEFKEKSAAEMAIQIERGLVQSPLTLQGLWEEENTQKKGASSAPTTSSTNSRVFPGFFAEKTTTQRFSGSFPSFSSAPDIFGAQQVKAEGEFENQVLANMRRAEERKRLIEKMKEEEEEEEDNS